MAPLLEDVLKNAESAGMFLPIVERLRCWNEANFKAVLWKIEAIFSHVQMVTKESWSKNCEKEWKRDQGPWLHRNTKKVPTFISSRPVNSGVKVVEGHCLRKSILELAPKGCHTLTVQ